jgi:hypothetical protein
MIINYQHIYWRNIKEWRIYLWENVYFYRSWNGGIFIQIFNLEACQSICTHLSIHNDEKLHWSVPNGTIIVFIGLYHALYPPLPSLVCSVFRVPQEKAQFTEELALFHFLHGSSTCCQWVLSVAKIYRHQPDVQTPTSTSMVVGGLGGPR